MIAVDAWLPSDGLTLEPNALRAAKEQARCLALTAGPGAGKTEMLAQRADFLLRTGTCRYPKRILAISFKVDASKNLKERIQRRCGQELASRFDSYTFHAFAKRIIDRFRVVLTGNDALDLDYSIGERKVTKRQITFHDLVPLAIQILKASTVARNAIRQTYSDVFLDEFQDCTDQQYELVKVAFQGTSIRLTAVGDTKQKIMGWAGALDGIFQTFARDFSAVPLNMYRNFRSKPRLLRMQNEIIRVLDPASVMPDHQLAGEEGEVFAWQFENAQGEAVLGKDIPYGDQPTGYALDPADTINYVSKHDNQTLWDNSQYRTAYSATTDQRVRMHNQSLSYAILAQGIPFLHMGSELLRSKSFLRDSYDYSDWFNFVDYSMQSNNYHVGLPPKEKDEVNWPLIKTLLEKNEGRDMVSPREIKFAAEVFTSFIAIRANSPLFRLTSEQQIIDKVSFLNTGKQQQLGLIDKIGSQNYHQSQMGE